MQALELAPSVQSTTQPVHYSLPPLQYSSLSRFHLHFSRLIFSHYLQPCCVLWSTLIFYFPLCIPVITNPSLHHYQVSMLSSGRSHFGSTDKDIKQRVSRETGGHRKSEEVFLFKLTNGGKSLCCKQKQWHVRKEENGNSAFLGNSHWMKQ